MVLHAAGQPTALDENHLWAYKSKHNQMKGNVMIIRRRVLAGTSLVLGDLAALLALRPDLGALADDVAAPHAWAAEVGADGAAATLVSAALWCVALWLGVGLLAAVATRLPGSLGRVARSLTRVLLPGAVYRVVAGAAGLGVLLAPVAAGAAGVSACLPGGGRPAAAALSAAPIPVPTWPVDAARPTPTVRAPIWPVSPAPTSHADRAGRAVPGGRQDRTPAASSPRPATQPARQARPPGAASAERGVVVRSGDSLWRIAATQLGGRPTPRRIAAVWPRWYAANRGVIGADPGLIRPGQLLQAPTATRGAR
jgi:hypothetical protein